MINRSNALEGGPEPCIGDSLLKSACGDCACLLWILLLEFADPSSDIQIAAASSLARNCLLCPLVSADDVLAWHISPNTNFSFTRAVLWQHVHFGLFQISCAVSPHLGIIKAICHVGRSCLRVSSIPAGVGGRCQSGPSARSFPGLHCAPLQSSRSHTWLRGPVQAAD